MGLGGNPQWCPLTFDPWDDLRPMTSPHDDLITMVTWPDPLGEAPPTTGATYTFRGTMGAGHRSRRGTANPEYITTIYDYPPIKTANQAELIE